MIPKPSYDADTRTRLVVIFKCNLISHAFFVFFWDFSFSFISSLEMAYSLWWIYNSFQLLWSFWPAIAYANVEFIPSISLQRSHWTLQIILISSSYSSICSETLENLQLVSPYFYQNPQAPSRTQQDIPFGHRTRPVHAWTSYTNTILITFCLLKTLNTHEPQLSQ